jgi:AcrR family transcriptional regulator
MRRQGATVQEIADHLGVSQPTATRRLQAGLQAVVESEVHELRALESQRLDGVLARLQAVLDAPGTRPEAVVQACRAIISTVDSRRQLFGLAPPTQVELDASSSLPPHYLQHVLSRALASIPGPQ